MTLHLDGKWETPEKNETICMAQCHEETSEVALKLAKMLLAGLSSFHKISPSKLGQLKRRTFLAWLINMDVA